MNQPEREMPSKRIVRLNEEFLMFEPGSTRKQFTQTAGDEQFFGSPVTLDTNGFLPQFSLNLYTAPSRSSKANAITPFNPELGHVITNQDFSLPKRAEKIRSMRDEDIDSDQAPLFLKVGNWSDSSLESHGLGYKEGRHFKLRPDYLSRIEQLRIQLFFPNGLRFEGRPDDSSLATFGHIHFRVYYPIDTGPLPTDQTRITTASIQAGFGLYVPSDISKISQIKVKIIRTNEKGTEVVDGGIPGEFSNAFEDDPD